jgi:hypothetical protein
MPATDERKASKETAGSPFSFLVDHRRQEYIRLPDREYEVVCQDDPIAFLGREANDKATGG